MKSNIKYFTDKSMWLFSVAVAYGAFMGLVGYDGDTADVVSYFLIGMAVMNLAGQVTTFKTHIPMALSFGSTRKNLFKGLIWFQLLNALLGTATVTILTIITNPGWEPMFMALMSVGVLLVAQALGCLIGIVIHKFKGIAAFLIIMAVSIGITSGVAIGIIVFRQEISDLTAKGITSHGPFVVALVVLLVWGVAQLLQKKTVYNYSL